MADITSTEEFASWLAKPEGSHLEFKTAAASFSKEKLMQYCCALANERGGKMVLGVTDKIPRQIVGTKAFPDPGELVYLVAEQLHMRIEYEERDEEGRRVLILHVPSRPLGLPLSFEKIYWMRAGESLKEMTPDMLHRIFDETGPDYSAEICTKAKFTDLDPKAIATFRSRWIARSGNHSLAHKSDLELLMDAELIFGDEVSFAALILFGTAPALSRHLAQAEVIFEYRSLDSSLPYQQRLEFREGFFNYADRLWGAINARNDLQSFQSGLFRFEIPTFAEASMREALLNAVGHRDYRLAGSIFVRQFQRHVEIVSPGGFPAGVTPENILDQQNPRNRRLAETFTKCGLIERSGQGMNRMFEESIRQSKPLPDFSGSAEHEVRLTLRGEIQNPAFLGFLQKVGEQRLTAFSTGDFLVLDAIQRDLPISAHLKPRLAHLIEMGIVETLGRGRGVRYLLARQFHEETGKLGTYTRKRGLDRETNKELLMRHLRDKAPDGAALSELHQVLPGLSERMIQTLLEELKVEQRAALEGQRRWARWFALPRSKPKT